MTQILFLLKTLWTLWTIHLILMTAVICLFYFLLTKVQTQMRFEWKTPVLISIFLFFGIKAHSIFEAYQNQVITEAQNLESQKQTKAYLEKKEAFIKAVDSVIQTGQPPTPEAKEKVFKDFQDLIPNNESKIAAGNAIFTVYTCQQFFFEDALNAYKNRKFIKSENRQKCEGYNGNFFNREKIVPPQLAQQNDEVIKLIAKREPVPIGEGKTQEISEKQLSESLKKQIQSAKTVQSLFQ